MNEQLEKALNDAVEARTFTMEAAKAIAALRDELAKSKKDYEVLASNNVQLERRFDDLSERETEQREKIKSLESSYFELQRREGEFLRNEMTAVNEALRRQDIFQLVQTIFKNTTIKETLNKTTVTASSGGSGCGTYPSSTPHTDTREVTTE